MNGNLEMVREALGGITGQAVAPPPMVGPDRYLVMARMNREFDTVDSLRRHGVAAWWPNYEELVPTSTVVNGRKLRLLRRVGILPGCVFGAVEPGFSLLGLLDRIVGAIDVARSWSGNPILVHDADVAILKKIEIGLNTPRSPEKVIHSFKCGQKVRFTDDLAGRWGGGRIVRLSRDGRISVEVNLMGRQVPVTVLPFQIERM